MIVTTTETVPGHRITRSFGLVRGNTIRARHLGRDIGALIRNITGGEIKEYTKLMAESREQAIDRMVAEAERLGANAVVGVRFMTAMIATGAAEILGYGTAVALEEDRSSPRRAPSGRGTTVEGRAPDGARRASAAGARLRRPPAAGAGGRLRRPVHHRPAPPGPRAVSCDGW